MSSREDNPLSRWSRLKQESRKREQEQRAKSEEAKALPEPAKTEEPPPALPPVGSLTPQSDFQGFMHPKVADSVRRVALKKLFADPHFNAPDVFEPFSGDWTVGEAIPQEMLKQLNQAYTLLLSDEEKKVADEERAHLDEAARDAAAAAQEQPDPMQEAKQLTQEGKPDEPGRQDT